MTEHEAVGAPGTRQANGSIVRPYCSVHNCHPRHCVDLHQSAHVVKSQKLDTGICTECFLPAYRSQNGDWHHNATFDQSRTATKKHGVKLIHPVSPISLP